MKLEMGLQQQHVMLCLQVVVRCHPMSEKERSDGRQRIVDMDVDGGQVMVRAVYHDVLM